MGCLSGIRNAGTCMILTADERLKMQIGDLVIANCVQATKIEELQAMVNTQAKPTGTEKPSE